jgi:hypothetical protein
VKGELANAALLSEVILREGSVDVVGDLSAVFQIFQDLLRAVGKRPSSRLKLGGHSVAL